MSLTLEFEPHSWYMGFAIQDWGKLTGENSGNPRGYRWQSYTDNGNTYRIDEIETDTLPELKQKIRVYHLSKFNSYGYRIAKQRLEYLRRGLRAGRVSYGELAELFRLHEYIEPGDVELLEVAGVPE